MKMRFPIWIKTIAVTLVIAMVYYFAGYRLVYSIVMRTAKNDAAFAMRHDATITNMALTSAQFNNITWTDKGKEFSYNDQLYDVVSMVKNGDSYIFKVYIDKNETHWAKAMNDFVKCLFPGDNGKKPTHAEGLLSAFQKEYTPLEKMNVAYSYEIKSVKYTNGHNHCRSTLLIKPIWHPPASC